jgi:predicted RNA-binding protein with PUA-like domain
MRMPSDGRRRSRRWSRADSANSDSVDSLHDPRGIAESPRWEVSDDEAQPHIQQGGFA